MLFKEIDYNNQNQIDKEEFGNFLKKYSIHVEDEYVTKLFNKYTNGNNVMTLNEFKNM